MLSEEKGVEFEPMIAMTDTDVKDRKALLDVWPAIILLLCMFHVAQAWKNKLTKMLGSRVSDSVVAGVRSMVVAQVRDMLSSQIFTTAMCGVEFCQYLSQYWLWPGILGSWCRSRRPSTSRMSGIPLQRIPNTNNHLESFNSVFRTHSLAAIQTGQRARIDLLVAFEIRSILPDILSPPPSGTLSAKASVPLPSAPVLPSTTSDQNTLTFSPDPLQDAAAAMLLSTSASRFTSNPENPTPRPSSRSRKPAHTASGVAVPAGSDIVVPTDEGDGDGFEGGQENIPLGEILTVESGDDTGDESASGGEELTEEMGEEFRGDWLQAPAPPNRPLDAAFFASREAVAQQLRELNECNFNLAVHHLLNHAALDLELADLHPKGQEQITAIKGALEVLRVWSKEHTIRSTGGGSATVGKRKEGHSGFLSRQWRGSGSCCSRTATSECNK
ncbi:hypothetical protein BDK51DRAFT_49609 [Blyttiomyces helicus]|uniref:MULE transposase domain-containing protein n=1 Tax=Blyttiomyces helicus TaxID=388810 RepID=A0A4P9VZ02_9FUNG|nr:hypothetical protein BDK51DRAFT_49609 [Blyttiomyces helicus]|eukprot:RKO83568.1 hypothetical protein BDK51DRAFT_49609 [Blyttiomyces helicus]